MSSLLLFALLSGAPAMSMTMPAADDNCVLDAVGAAKMIEASYQDFDETMDGAESWRPLLERGCYRAAAKIIAEYVAAHESELSPVQKRTLRFHAGQTLAMGGHDGAAIAWIEASKDAAASGEWNAYVDATAAFLHKDRPRLVAARTAYASQKDSSPMRKQLIEGFSACMEQTYNEAMACTDGSDAK